MSGAKPATVTIDRLALEIPGFDPGLAAHLAFLVASHLAAYGGPAADVAIPRLAVTLGAGDTGVEAMAWAIARAVRARAG